MSSSYRLELDKYLSRLEVKANKCLDLGGSQLPAKGRTKTWEVGKYIIADLPEPHVDSPKPEVEIDLNRRYKKDEFDKYDLIFVLEVFDYIWNPFEAFRTIKHLLEKDGRAIITFPSVYPLHQPIADDALRYMPGGITKLAEAVDLKIEEMIPRVTETNQIYEAFRAERMRCAKHERHDISGWIVELRR